MHIITITWSDKSLGTVILNVLTLILLRQCILIFTHLKLCLATATHNFKWVKITHIVFSWDQTFANIDV